jgi:hypothetical protein
VNTLRLARIAFGALQDLHVDLDDVGRVKDILRTEAKSLGSAASFESA